jgi:K+-sensing histidine kinase KdpD
MSAPEQRDASASELVKQLSDQTSRLVRQELELLRAELAIKGKQAGAGAGLGLYVSRNILHAAGGELTYTTEVGVGSTFRVELPALEAA